MKRILSIACILFSGYASAQVEHPENTNIVATIAGLPHSVCIENDGSVDPSTCVLDSSNTDGVVSVIASSWFSGSGVWHIGGCDDAAVSPVSIANCPLGPGAFASCVNDGYALVQSQSGYFFAVKANADCTGIATPETTGIVPCLSTDAFDPGTGCAPSNPTQIAVEGGYMKLDVRPGTPPAAHCEDASHHGRMVVDSALDLLYLCTPSSGWKTFSPDPQ